MNQLIEYDHSMFLAINNGWENPFFDTIMPLATHLGEAQYLSLIVIPLLYLTDKKNFPKNILLFALVLTATGLIGQVIKRIVSRPRPLSELSDLIIAHKASIHVLGRSLYAGSFPSGHTLTAFSAATFLSFKFRKFTAIFFLAASLIGLSRVYVGAHFPLDVFGGALIATLVTFLLCFWIQKKYPPKKLS